MKTRYIAILMMLLTLGLIASMPAAAAAQKAKPEKPAISEEARAALTRMGQTLRAAEFSFKVQTIRVYTDPGGQPLHIFHKMKVTVHRPNRLSVDITGDDGSNKLLFDGKNAVVFSAAQNKYTVIPVAGGTIDAMLKEVIGRIGVDFPLADFLTESPNEAFLTGVASGRVVDTVTIDGTPYMHLFFAQPPGIELELWLEKSDKALPYRLIVTYRNLPGQPNFIAMFSDWDFAVHPPDSEFAFEPPPGAQQVELKPPAAAAKNPARNKAGKQ